MKTIGLIGGMSWHSSMEYYRIINEVTSLRLGGCHSAQCVMWSVDFGPVEKYQREDDWDNAGDIVADAAKRVEKAGADLIVLCSNTMHVLADRIWEAVTTPMLHIADAVGQEIRASGLNTVGLLGTRYTMEHGFYTEHLSEKHGISVLLPDSEDRNVIHNTIFDTLSDGESQDISRERFKVIADKLVERGAEGIVLGSAEIGILMADNDAPAVPLLDTAKVHAIRAVDWALSD